MAIRSETGSRKARKPASASSAPMAVHHPQPRMPRARKSKELTNLLMPENSSHMPKMYGRDSSVKAWWNSRNSDSSTVRMPSARNQPAPATKRLALAKMTKSMTPESSMATPRYRDRVARATPGLLRQIIPATSSRIPATAHKILDTV